ncbi:transcription factor Opi1-domain-containing protein [Mycena olivaceomarginata]|nr:transcription factor Opi1-domain-containing protein [Mycena olivaceomarginata]
MIRRPCGLALEACARDSTTCPLQPAWAGAGCLPNLRSSIFFALVPAPCRSTVRAQALGTVSTLAFWWYNAGAALWELDKYRPPLPHRLLPPTPFAFSLQSADDDDKEDPRREPARGRGGGRVRTGRGGGRGGMRRRRRGGGGEGERVEGRDRREVREREGGDGREGRGEGRVPGWLEATSPYVAPPGPPPPFRREAHDSGGPNGNGVREGDERQVAQRSRWQAVLLEAGGLSAALSDDIRNATHRRADPHPARLYRVPPSAPPPGSSLAISPDAPEPELTPDHLRTLAHLRSDIVHTIRQAVGVVSKYAGGALPEPARGRVRGFILDLSKRFSAESSGSGGMSPGAAGVASATGVAAAAGSGGASRSVKVTASQRGHKKGRFRLGNGPKMTKENSCSGPVGIIG